MKQLTFKSQLTEIELNKMVAMFSTWQASNLTITYGKIEATVEGTFGLPYTSSSAYAMLSNTNTIAELKHNTMFKFEHLSLTPSNEVVAVFYDAEENGHFEILGTITSDMCHTKYQITLNDVIKGVYNDDETGLTSIDYDNQSRLLTMFKDYLLRHCRQGSNPYKAIKHKMVEDMNRYGIFDRFVVHNGSVKYITGQDYTAEMNTLKKCFMK